MQTIRLRLSMCALSALSALCVVTILALPGAATAAGTLATITIVDGDATLLRDAARHALAEGVKLEADDIAETGAQTQLLRLEFADGLILDLGPAARLWLAPKFTRDPGRPARFYLQEGWAKVTVPKTTPAPSAAFATPAFDVTAVTRQLVVSLKPGEVMLFNEAGESTVVDRRGGKAQPPALQLKADQFLARSGDDKPSVTTRPTPAFLKGVPRAFLDPIPERAGLFKSRDVAPKKLNEIEWTDAQLWVDGETAIRPAFLARWKSLAANPEFKKGLMNNERAHPEWDRVLHPEKYLPRASPAGPMRHP